MIKQTNAILILYTVVCIDHIIIIVVVVVVLALPTSPARSACHADRAKVFQTFASVMINKYLNTFLVLREFPAKTVRSRPSRIPAAAVPHSPHDGIIKL